MMSPFQVCQTQVLSTGAFLTGVLPNGTDSAETILRGRYRKWTACTDGGLFQQPFESTLHTSMSGSVRGIFWNLPSVTGIIFSLVDMDGVEVPFYPAAGTASVSRGWIDPQQSILVLPKGALKITGTGPLGSTGIIMVTWLDGMARDMFTDLGVLGTERLVPMYG